MGALSKFCCPASGGSRSDCEVGKTSEVKRKPRRCAPGAVTGLAAGVLSAIAASTNGLLPLLAEKELFMPWLGINDALLCATVIAAVVTMTSESSEVMVDTAEDPPTYRCERCAIDVPLRTVHCPTCDKCVAQFDHHNSILGVCIGQSNKRTFVTALVLALSYLSSSLAMSITAMCMVTGFDLDVSMDKDIWTTMMTVTGLLTVGPIADLMRRAYWQVRASYEGVTQYELKERHEEGDRKGKCKEADEEVKSEAAAEKAEKRQDMDELKLVLEEAEKIATEERRRAADFQLAQKAAEASLTIEVQKKLLAEKDAAFALQQAASYKAQLDAYLAAKAEEVAADAAWKEQAQKAATEARLAADKAIAAVEAELAAQTERAVLAQKRETQAVNQASRAKGQLAAKKKDEEVAETRLSAEKQRADHAEKAVGRFVRKANRATSQLVACRAELAAMKVHYEALKVQASRSETETHVCRAELAAQTERALFAEKRQKEVSDKVKESALAVEVAESRHAAETRRAVLLEKQVGRFERRASRVTTQLAELRSASVETQREFHAEAFKAHVQASTREAEDRAHCAERWAEEVKVRASEVEKQLAEAEVHRYQAEQEKEILRDQLRGIVGVESNGDHVIVDISDEDIPEIVLLY